MNKTITAADTYTICHRFDNKITGYFGPRLLSGNLRRPWKHLKNVYRFSGRYCPMFSQTSRAFPIYRCFTGTERKV